MKVREEVIVDSQYGNQEFDDAKKKEGSVRHSGGRGGIQKIVGGTIWLLTFAGEYAMMLA